LSLDGFQVSVRPVWETLDATRPVGVEGGVVSPEGGGGEQASVEALRAVAVERLPAASKASTPIA
jgi:hypothetical protein